MKYTFEELERCANNPTRVINDVLNFVQQALDGTQTQFNSPSHPFVVSLDMITGQAWGLINRHEDAVSKLYRFHARTMNDLGRDMADADWYGMFANPATTTMAFVLPTSEIERLAVDFSETDGNVINTYRKLVIPKDTRVKVMGIYFMTETPIEIRLMSHGGHSVVYDANNISPFNPISQNILDKDYVIAGGVRFLRINVPMRQLNCTPKFNIASTTAGGLKDTFQYEDYLYGIRAVINYPDGSQSPLSVVYNTQVYDQTRPSLTIDLDSTNKRFTYEIPDVYINNGSGVGSVNLFVYTTKGAYEQDLKVISVADHVPEYLDLNFDNGNLNQYSSPMREVNDNYWKTITAVSGGSVPRSFASVRQAQIYGNRRDSLPITPNQQSFDVTDYGYSSVLAIDYYTNRIFRLTRELPQQQNKDFQSSMGCYIGSMLYSMDELAATGVVKNNGERITIPSRTLVRLRDTTNQIVSAGDLQNYRALSNDSLVDLVENNRFVYLPFHYVLDATQNQVDVRMYYLDNPKVNYQKFWYENASLGVELGIGSVVLEYKDDGYTMTVSTRSGTDYKALKDEDVGVQLCFTPESTDTLASMRGELVGKTEKGERVWQFKLGSNFDVDSNDRIYLEGFSQYGKEQPTVMSPLTNNFSLLFLSAGTSDSGLSDSDAKIDTSLFQSSMLAIIESRFNVTLGQAMNGMYTRARPITGDAKFQRHEKDIPLTYGVDVFQRDTNKELVFGDDNLPVLLHRATDVVYDSSGDPVLLYRKGDLVKDHKGGFVELEPRKLRYHYDFVGFDGAYFFSTDSYDADYAANTKSYIADTVMKDMEAFNARSLDETKIVFSPKVKLGNSKVVANADLDTTMNLDLSFSVVFYLSRSGFQNTDLQAAIRKSTPGTINSALGGSTVSMSELQSLLKKMAGDETVDVKVETFMGDTSIDVVSYEDASSGFSVRKVLELTTENVLSVKENISVDFKQHKK